MSTVEQGKKVPDFELPGTSGLAFRLAERKGKNVVIYFYPKDNTPGCTSEGQEFRDLYPEFAAADTEIYGISRDGLRSHENFRAKYHLPFELLSDGDEEACKLFDVLHEKVMYGRRVMGIVRSTFLIDKKGVLRQEWRKVRVAGHAQEVLEAARALR
jgi:peroxiredoxin Q/BCP